MAKTVNHGHAVYFELHSTDGKDATAQFVVVGETARGENILPYRMYSRTITPENPQTKWRPDVANLGQYTATALSGGLLRAVDSGSAVSSARDFWSPLAGTVDAVLAAGFEPVGDPFVVQVSELDIADMAAQATPKKLLDRIRSVRLERGMSPLPSAATRAVV